MKYVRLMPLALILGTALQGCGGGSDSNTQPTPTPPPPANVAPSVSIAATSIEEKQSVSITADVSDDGTIQSYVWEQLSGQSVTLENTDTATVSFVAPSVLADEIIELRLTATDNDDASTSAQVTVDVLSKQIAVEVNGLVTDGPIANANVVITFGDQTVTTTADQNGAYTASFSVDDSYENTLVIGSATGPENDSIVSLKSIMGSVGDLAAASGEDSLLNNEELFATNITNVSTASAISLEIANNGPIENLADLSNAQINNDASIVLPLATVIKLVIDYAPQEAQLALPEGFSNTLEFASDPNAVSAYIENATTNVLWLYEEAQDAIINDSNLIDSSITVDEIVGTYYVISPEGTHGGFQVEFNADNSGREIFPAQFGQSTGEKAFQWANTDDGILVTYDEPETSVSFVYTDQFGNIEQVSTHISTRYKIVTQETDKVQFSRESFFTTTYPNGERPDSSFTNTSISASVRESGRQNAADFLEMGVEYAIAVPSELISIDQPTEVAVRYPYIDVRIWYQKARFFGSISAGGTVQLQSPVYDNQGESTYVESTANWSINEEGEIVIVDGDSQLTISVLTVEDGLTPYTSVRLSKPDSLTAGSGPMMKQESPWGSDNIAGIYVLNWEWLDANNEPFWIELYEDGTSLQVSTWDRNRDGELTTDEITVWPTQWRVNEDGTMTVRRYLDILLIDGVLRCVPDTFDTTTQDACVRFNDRVMDLYSVVERNGEERAYMVHTHKFFRDYELKSTLPDYSGVVAESISSGGRYWIKQSERPLNIDDAMSALSKSETIAERPADIR